MSKKHNHSHNQNSNNEKSEQKNHSTGITKKDIYQVAGQMSMGCWMLPPGSFPYGYWYLY